MTPPKRVLNVKIPARGTFFVSNIECIRKNAICQKNAPDTLCVAGVVLVDSVGGDVLPARNAVLNSERFCENVMIFSAPTDDGEMTPFFFLVDE